MLKECSDICKSKNKNFMGITTGQGKNDTKEKRCYCADKWKEVEDNMHNRVDDGNWRCGIDGTKIMSQNYSDVKGVISVYSLKVEESPITARECDKYFLFDKLYTDDDDDPRNRASPSL